MNSSGLDASDLPTWQQDIRALEAEHCRAYVARDFDLLDRLWSDDLLVNSPINRVHDKQRVLDLLRAGIISHSAMECHAESMTQLGRFVIVMGSERVTNSSGGPVIQRRYTNMWHETDGVWQLVARHANIVSDAAGAA